MTVEIARNRIAKIRNDMCYSHMSRDNAGLINNKENNNSTSEVVNWFEVR